MKLKDSVSAIEAILFAHGDPIEGEKLRAAAGVEPGMVEKLVQLLMDRYEENGSALTVLKLGNSYQLAVKPDYSGYVRAALETRKNAPLSPAAMEVLTIIAYNQPVTKGFVEHVRGIDSSSVVNSLVEKNLLEEAGRLDVPGKPIAYKTTPAFLRSFQLTSLDDLPPPPDADGQVSFDEILIKNEDGEDSNPEYAAVPEESTENEPEDAVPEEGTEDNPEDAEPGEKIPDNDLEYAVPEEGTEDEPQDAEPGEGTDSEE